MSLHLWLRLPIASWALGRGRRFSIPGGDFFGRDTNILSVVMLKLVAIDPTTLAI